MKIAITMKDIFEINLYMEKKNHKKRSEDNSITHVIVCNL